MSITSTTTARPDRKTGRTHSGKRARKNNMLCGAQARRWCSPGPAAVSAGIQPTRLPGR